MWRLDHVLRAVGGAVLKVEEQSFSGVSTDSRTIGPGELFVPLDGPNFDGHAYVADANRRSGGGSLCRRGREAACASAVGTVILVDDTRQALMDLARTRRREIDARFVAITGSNGKTSTKELLVHILGGTFRAVANERNYNNQIGVSKTILAIEGKPEVCILELGTNHPGEIASLARVVEPDLSLITNVNASHLEGLGDIHGVLKEKASLFELTKRDGTILVNLDDPNLAPLAGTASQRVFTFAIRGDADYRLFVEENLGFHGYALRLALAGHTVDTRTPLIGTHNLYNILAAAAAAHALGAPPEEIGRRVATFQAYPGRFNIITSDKGYTIIDDTYNANPASMAYAIDTLVALPSEGKKIAVIGDMRELGKETERFHHELGRHLKGCGVAEVLFYGSDVRAAFTETGNGHAKLFEDKGALIEYAAAKTGQGDVVLVKGSRALKMDEIVEALR
jgi:UDP-N-acetylmuramoyl-tripeptide--D-alanyl-D-alanine ligase